MATDRPFLHYRQYETGDLWLLRGRLIPSAEDTYLYEEWLQKGYALTFMKNRQVEACLGLAPLDDGIELWSAPSVRLVETHLLEYCRLVRNLIAATDTHRGDLVVHLFEDDAKTERWLEWLGFEDHGVRKDGGIKMLHMTDEEGE